MSAWAEQVESPLARVVSASHAYSVEVDSADEASWNEIVSGFADASIYQTAAYGISRWGADGLSRMVLRRDGRIVAAAQARIVTVPLIGAGAAYIPWGPVWRTGDGAPDPDDVRRMARALREEYVERRSLLLRIRPNVVDGESDGVASILEEEGYDRKPSDYRTLLIDLSPDLEELRAGLRPKWRRDLNVATRKNLNIVAGTDEKLYATFTRLYGEMIARKKFDEFVDVHEFGEAQRNLPDELKMLTIVAEHEGHPVASIVSARAGDTAIYLLGATGDAGLRLRASNLLHWRMIELLKRTGCRWYDLGGIDPIENPGTYRFKAGLAGRSGLDVHHIGRFEARGSLASLIAIRSGERLRSAYRKLLNLRKRLGRSS